MPILIVIFQFISFSFLGFAIMVPILTMLKERGDTRMGEWHDQVLDWGTRIIRVTGLVYVIPFLILLVLVLTGDFPLINEELFETYIYWVRMGILSSNPWLIILTMAINILPAILAQLFWFPKFKESVSTIRLYSGAILLFYILKRLFFASILDNIESIYPGMMNMDVLGTITALVSFKDALMIAGFSILAGLAVLFWIQKIRFSQKK